MKKTFGDILDRMTYILKGMGIEYADITRDQAAVKARGHAYEQAIQVKQDGLTLSVVVRATIKPEAVQMNPNHPATKGYLQSQHYSSYNQYSSLPKRHYLRYNWSIVFRVLMRDNTYKLVLKMKKETLGNKVTKFFGGRDLEVYNQDFDKLFWVEGNNNYAHATLLNNEIQEKLIEEVERFHKLEVRNYYVTYLTPHIKRSDLRSPKYQQHYKTIIEICLALAKNVNEWKPPMD